MEKEIIELTKTWYYLVSLDHHKDRDCHWHIVKDYSYGQPAKYRVEHAGYIYKDISEEYSTADEAHDALIEFLKDAIKKEEEWARDVLKSPKEWDEYQVENAGKIINKLTNLHGTH